MDTDILNSPVGYNGAAANRMMSLWGLAGSFSHCSPVEVKPLIPVHASAYALLEPPKPDVSFDDTGMSSVSGGNST